MGGHTINGDDARDPQSEKRLERRRMLRLGGIAAAGAVAATVANAKPAAAGVDGDVVLGSNGNVTGTPTGIAVSGTSAGYGFGTVDNGLASIDDKRPAILAHAAGHNFRQAIFAKAEGPVTTTAIWAESVAGYGVIVKSGGSRAAIHGECSGDGNSVEGIAVSGIGVGGFSETGPGVQAESGITALVASAWGPSGNGAVVSTNDAQNADAALRANTAGTGEGVVGVSALGTGVAGQSLASTGDGVLGTATAGRGVFGIATTGTGVLGSAANGIGVAGNTLTGHGVLGTNSGTGGFGVYARLQNASNADAALFAESIGKGSAVRADNTPTATKPTVAATSLAATPAVDATGRPIAAGGAVAAAGNGPALNVIGVASFARSGVATIAAGVKTVVVSIPGGLTAASNVLVTMKTTTTAAVGVKSATPKPSTGKVTITLTANAPASGIKVAWFVFG